MSEILITTNYRSRPVRLVATESGVRFVVRDVCDILGYSNPNKALKRIGNTRREYTRLKTNGGMQSVRLVSPQEMVDFLNASNSTAIVHFSHWFSETIIPFLNLGCGWRR